MRAVAGWALCLAALGACSSRDFDAVRNYKEFLGEARPSLVAMNNAREELYQLNDPDQMLPIFRDKLLPRVRELERLSAEQAQPEARLGEIHLTLQQTLERYAKSTGRLVERLKSKNEDEREQAIVMWGEDDQKFGREMSTLVDDLTRYLDQLKK